MAVKVATATFTGSQNSVDVTWTGIGASHHISVGVIPSDGYGAVQPWLTNRFNNGATVNVSGPWQGTINLTVVDAPTLAPQPSAFQVTDLVSAADNVHGVVGPLGTPLDNVIAMLVPSSVTSIQVQYAHRVLAYPGGSLSQPSSGISGAKLAVGPLHTNGQSWTGTPTVITGITLPSGGALYTSPTIDITGMRNANGEIGIAWSIPTGQTIYGEQPGYFGYGATNEDVSGLSGLVAVNINPLFVSTKYSVASSLKRFIIIGDSLTRGLSSSFGDTNPTYKQTLGWLIGQRSNTVCNRAGGSGQTLLAWADIAGRPWLWDFEQFAGATVLVWLGTNDVNGGSTTAMQMLNALQTIVERCYAMGAFKVYATTVAPSSTYSGAQNTTRNDYGTAVLAKPFNIKYVLDVAAVTKDSGNPNILASGYGCTDNIHLTATANTALKDQGVTDGVW